MHAGPRRYAALVAAVAAVVLALPASSLAVPTPPPGFIDTLVASGLEQGTAMAFDPSGRLFVTLQGGSVRVIRDGQLLPTPFVTLSVDSVSERGLLGVAFDPSFDSNHYVYLYYTVPGSPVAQPDQPLHGRAATSPLPGSEVVLLDLQLRSARRPPTTTAEPCTSAATASCTSPSATTTAVGQRLADSSTACSARCCD